MGPSVADNFYGDIVGLGLDSGLVRCVDAGSADSYSGSGQIWADLSPAGNDLYLGDDGSASANDPTFVGTAGEIGPTTYFRADGNDRFAEVSRVADAWSKNNALFTASVLFYNISLVGSYPLLSNNDGANSIGYFIEKLSSNCRVEVGRGGADALQKDTIGAAIQVGWNLVTVSQDEGAGTLLIDVNGTTESFTGTYTIPSASDPANVTKVFGYGTGSGFAPANTRLARLAMWNGAALTAPQIAALYAKQQELFTTLP